MLKVSIASVLLKEVKSIEDAGRLGDFFLPEELQPRQLIRLAGKLAAKRAFVKNLSLKADSTLLRSIQVVRSNTGRPSLYLHDKAVAEKASLHNFSLSISHTDNLAVALLLSYGVNA